MTEGRRSTVLLLRAWGLGVAVFIQGCATCESRVPGVLEVAGSSDFDSDSAVFEQHPTYFSPYEFVHPSKPEELVLGWQTGAQLAILVLEGAEYDLEGEHSAEDMGARLCRCERNLHDLTADSCEEVAPYGSYRCMELSGTVTFHSYSVGCDVVTECKANFDVELELFNEENGFEADLRIKLKDKHDSQLCSQGPW